jgi:Methylase involved in ubiquinone/menaquinone biosynthesis
MGYKEKLNSNYYSSKSVVHDYSIKSGLLYPEKEILDKFIDTSMDILDIGCGAGRTTAYLKAISKTIIGIDISDKMVEVARAGFPDIEFKTMDAADLRFADDSFDAVVFSFNGIDCLYPEEQRIKVYKEAYRVLKSRGVFIYSSHVVPSLFAGFYEVCNFLLNVIALRVFNRYRFEVHKNGMVFLYYGNDKKEIQALDDVGFNIMDVVANREKNPAWNYYVCKKR